MKRYNEASNVGKGLTEPRMDRTNFLKTHTTIYAKKLLNILLKIRKFPFKWM